MLRGPRHHAGGPPVDDLVVGAIGRPRRRILRRLEGALATPLVSRIRSPHAVLLSAAPLETWHEGQAHGAVWSSQAAGSSPHDWSSASQDRLAAGLAVDPARAWLHADGLGLADLFVRRLDDAVYFSNRLAPLAVLTPGSLTADLDAWASILSAGSPLGERTPYLEIRRVPAATAWGWDGDRLTTASYTPRWVDQEQDPSITADDVAGAVHDCFPTASERVEVPLTGGWDSRLLAGVALHHGQVVRAWTTTGDAGEDLDLRLAAPVAEALGIEHHVLMPAPEQWYDEVEQHRLRMEHRTWYHVGLAPLARAVEAAGGVGAERSTVLDGLGGDILIKGLWGDRPFQEAPDRQEHLWRVLGGWRLDSQRIPHDVRTELRDRARAEFAAAGDRWRGHPQELALTILANRTTQVTALSPLTLFAPGADVRLPFLHPDLVTLLLRVPPEQKFDGALYREVLGRLLGDIGRLPSTNDDLQPAKTPSTQTTRAAMDRLEREISASSAAGALLVDGAMTSLRDPATGTARLSGSVHLMQAAALLADWEQRSPRTVRFPAWPSGSG
jgi:asparagine synthetase B (glutamine-hydrolysing)